MKSATKAGILKLAVVFSIVLVISLCIPHVTLWGFGVGTEKVEADTAPAAGSSDAQNPSTYDNNCKDCLSRGYRFCSKLIQPTNSDGKCIKTNQACTEIASGTEYIKYWDGTSGNNLNCPQPIPLSGQAQTTTQTDKRKPDETMCDFCMRKGQKYCKPIQTGSAGFNAGNCRDACNVPYEEEYTSCPPPPTCSSVCFNYMFYRNLMYVGGTSQQMAMPIGQCSKEMPLFVLGTMYGQQSTSGLSAMPQPTGGYGPDVGDCNPGEQCWCIQVNMQQFQQNTASTNYPSSTIPGRMQTTHWVNPDWKKNPPASSIDQYNGVPSNGTVNAKIDAQLFQAGDAVTVKGSVAKRCATCDGWSYTCEAQKELACKTDESGLLGRWSVKYTYDKCPSDLPEIFYKEGEKTFVKWKTVFSDLLTVYMLKEGGNLFGSKSGSGSGMNSMLLMSMLSSGTGMDMSKFLMYQQMSSGGNINPAMLMMMQSSSAGKTDALQLALILSMLGKNANTQTPATAKIIEGPIGKGMIDLSNVYGNQEENNIEKSFLPVTGMAGAGTSKTYASSSTIPSYNDDCDINLKGYIRCVKQAGGFQKSECTTFIMTKWNVRYGETYSTIDQCADSCISDTQTKQKCIEPYLKVTQTPDGVSIKSDQTVKITSETNNKIPSNLVYGYTIYVKSDDKTVLTKNCKDQITTNCELEITPDTLKNYENKKIMYWVELSLANTAYVSQNTIVRNPQTPNTYYEITISPSSTTGAGTTVTPTPSQIAAAQAQSSSKNDDSGCSSLNGVCKKIIEGINTGGFFKRNLCLSRMTETDYQCFFSNIDFDGCKVCTDRGLTWCYDFNNMQNGYCTLDDNYCVHNYVPTANCGTTSIGTAGTLVKPVCGKEYENLFTCDETVPGSGVYIVKQCQLDTFTTNYKFVDYYGVYNLKSSYQTYQECIADCKRAVPDKCVEFVLGTTGLPSARSVLIPSGTTTDYGTGERCAYDYECASDFCDYTTSMPTCQPSTASPSSTKATQAGFDWLKTALIAAFVLSLLYPEPGADYACYSVCGATYETQAGRAPVCAKGIGDAEVPVLFKNATYACTENACGMWQNKKIKIDVYGPAGNIVRSDFTTTDANGQFSYTFTAPLDDGEFSAIVSLPRDW